MLLCAWLEQVGVACPAAYLIVASGLCDGHMGRMVCVRRAALPAITLSLPKANVVVYASGFGPKGYEVNIVVLAGLAKI